MNQPQGTHKRFNFLGIRQDLVNSLTALTASKKDSDFSIPEPLQIHKTVHSDRVVLEIRRMNWLANWTPVKITHFLNNKGVTITHQQVSAFCKGINRTHLQPSATVATYLEN